MADLGADKGGGLFIIHLVAIYVRALVAYGYDFVVDRGKVC